MTVCNQGAVMDSITRSAKWPQASHVLLSPGYQPPLAWYSQSESLLSQTQKDSYSQWAAAAWTLCKWALHNPSHPGKASAIQPHSRLYSLPNWGEKKIATYKYPQEQGTEFSFKRNPEAKAEWMTYFFINQAKRTILCEKSMTFPEALTLNLNLFLMQRM